MRKTVNKEKIEGRVYDHSLELKTVENSESANFGKPFIQGTLDIATDDAGVNVVTINYIYVAEKTNSGKVNSTFTALKNIMEKGKTVVDCGMAEATMVKAEPALSLNDFYTNHDGEEKLVSAKRNEGGFVTILSKLEEEDKRNTFECDMLINETRHIDADEERGIAEDYLIVKGGIFKFNGALLPVELIVKNPNGIQYFESLEASAKNLIFTKVWGKIECQTIITKKEEVNAFGEPKVQEFPKTIKEWIITGAAENPYALDDEKEGITKEEVAKLISDREVYLADVKKKQEEYQANKAKGTTSTPAKNTATSAAAGGFNF